MVRVATRNLWRKFFAETDDPTTDDENQMVGGLPVDPTNDTRFKRLTARTFREQQQEINDLQAANTALEARVAALEAPE